MLVPYSHSYPQFFTLHTQTPANATINNPVSVCPFCVKIHQQIQHNQTNKQTKVTFLNETNTEKDRKTSKQQQLSQQGPACRVTSVEGYSFPGKTGAGIRKPLRASFLPPSQHFPSSEHPQQQQRSLHAGYTLLYLSDERASVVFFLYTRDPLAMTKRPTPNNGSHSGYRSSSVPYTPFSSPTRRIRTLPTDQ